MKTNLKAIILFSIIIVYLGFLFFNFSETNNPRIYTGGYSFQNITVNTSFKRNSPTTLSAKGTKNFTYKKRQDISTPHYTVAPLLPEKQLQLVFGYSYTESESSYITRGKNGKNTTENTVPSAFPLNFSLNTERKKDAPGSGLLAVSSENTSSMQTPFAPIDQMGQQAANDDDPLPGDPGMLPLGDEILPLLLAVAAFIYFKKRNNL